MRSMTYERVMRSMTYERMAPIPPFTNKTNYDPGGAIPPPAGLNGVTANGINGWRITLPVAYICADQGIA